MRVQSIRLKRIDSPCVPLAVLNATRQRDEDGLRVTHNFLRQLNVLRVYHVTTMNEEMDLCFCHLFFLHKCNHRACYIHENYVYFYTLPAISVRQYFLIFSPNWMIFSASVLQLFYRRRVVSFALHVFHNVKY